MSFPLLRLMVGIGLVVGAAACVPPPDIERRSVGSVFNPYCMPDGSVVRYQYSNSAGSFEGARGDPANCPWNKK